MVMGNGGGGAVAASVRTRRSRVALLFCGFYFLLFFAPSAPFLTPFLTGSREQGGKAVDLSQLYTDIFPLWTYGYAGGLVLTALLTDLLGHALWILVGATMSLTTVLLTVLPDSVAALQVSQITSGMIFASAASLFGLLYTVFGTMDFQRVTSWTRSAGLLATVLSGLLGQLLYLQQVPLSTLFYVTSGAAGGCVLIALLGFPRLSAVSGGLKVALSSDPLEGHPLPHGAPSSRELEQQSLLRDPSRCEKSWGSIQKREAGQGQGHKTCCFSVRQFAQQVLHTYTDRRSVWWSLFSAITLAIHQLFITYWQSLVQNVMPSDEEDSSVVVSNGYFVAVSYTVAALASLVPILLQKRLEVALPFAPTVFAFLSF